MNPVHGRAGISKLAVPVALIVVLVVAGGYFFLARNSTTTTQSTISSSLPSVSLRTEVNQFVQDINGRNVDEVLTFYSPSSVVVWAGRTGGLVGQYKGPENIRLIYAASIGKTSAMDLNISNYTEKVFSPTHINATFHGSIVGNSSVIGTLNATVDISQEWNWGSAGWQISKENWGYTDFSASLINSQFGSSTTFPQWGFMQKGGNPNLVSEKSFEWHAGPFLAAGVFAFLFSVIFVLAVRLRPRVRDAPQGEQTRQSVTEK